MRSNRVSKGLTTSMSVAAAVAFALYGQASWAQQAATQAPAAAAPAAADEGQLEEVVITAQKRTERLEDVPVSASVLSTTSLASSNVSDVSDLNKLVPAVNINGTISGRAPMGIRGISSVSNEQAVGVPSGVAIMIDGVPVPSDSYDGNQIEDVQNVEVLEGPQATLGGRTAAAGVINYRTYDPTDHLVGGFTGTGTTDHEWRGSAHISGPIAGNTLQGSLSVYDANRYLPITNTFYGTKADQRDWGVRGKLLWSITDDISAKFTYHHGQVVQTGFNFVYVHLTPGVKLFTGASSVLQSEDLGGIVPSWSNLDYKSPVTQAGHRHVDNDGQLDLSFNLGGGYTLTSTTAFQHEDQAQVQDLFATAVYGFDSFVSQTFQGGGPVTSDPHIFTDEQSQREFIEQKSEELKLVSPTDQPVSFVAGAFYSDTTINMIYRRGLPPALLDVDVRPDTATYDLYGRATWKVAQSTSLVTGLRYNYDKLSYTYVEQAYNGYPSTGLAGAPYYSANSGNGNSLVGDISVQQQFQPDVMGYATYAHGYSPKVFNTAATITYDGEKLDPVSQENIDHFEIGTKGTYLDRHLTVNFDIFDTLYHHYQIQQYELLPGQITSNLDLQAAGEAQTKGAELTTNWRATNYTTLAASVAYIDAVFGEYKGAPCQGFEAVGVPPANCSLDASSGSYIQDMSGKTMPNSPKWKLYLDAQQRYPLGAVDLVGDVNWAYRTKAEMLPDNSPDAIMGAFGIVNLSLGIQSGDGKWAVTAFVNNLFNKIYYQDVEDFWNGPWQNTSTIIAEPARDAVRYGGIRVNYDL